MRIVQHHRAAATEQMGETGLMCGVDELPIGCPAVALEHTAVVGAEHPRRLGKAAPVFDRIRRRVAGRKGPEPVRMPADFPASFIGRDDGAPGPGHTAPRRSAAPAARRDGPHGAVRPGHGEAEAIAQQVPDPAEGESTLFIENHGERDRLRPELHGRGAERVGGLQWVSALHAAVTLPALAHRDTKLMDDGALDGQVLWYARRRGGATPIRRSPDTARAAARRGSRRRAAAGADGPRGRTRRPTCAPGARDAPSAGRGKTAPPGGWHGGVPSRVPLSAVRSHGAAGCVRSPSVSDLHGAARSARLVINDLRADLWASNPEGVEARHGYARFTRTVQEGMRAGRLLTR